MDTPVVIKAGSYFGELAMLTGLPRGYHDFRNIATDSTIFLCLRPASHSLCCCNSWHQAPCLAHQYVSCSAVCHMVSLLCNEIKLPAPWSGRGVGGKTALRMEITSLQPPCGLPAPPIHPHQPNPTPHKPRPHQPKGNVPQ